MPPSTQASPSGGYAPSRGFGKEASLASPLRNGSAGTSAKQSSSSSSAAGGAAAVRGGGGPAQSNPAFTFVTGAGCSRGLPNVKSSFTIVARDSSNAQRTTGGDKFVIQVSLSYFGPLLFLPIAPTDAAALRHNGPSPGR
jgi:hypothetical protein